MAEAIDHQSWSKMANCGTTFSRGSSWAATYHDMLNPQPDLDRRIEWNSVEVYITQGIVDVLGVVKGNGFSPRQLNLEWMKDIGHEPVT